VHAILPDKAVIRAIQPNKEGDRWNLTGQRRWLVQSFLTKEAIGPILPNRGGDWCNPVWQKNVIGAIHPEKGGDWCTYLTEEVICAILPDKEKRWFVLFYLTKKVIDAILPNKEGDWCNPTWQRWWWKQSYLTKKVIEAILPDKEGDWCNPTWHRRWLVQSLLAMEWVYTVQTACRYKNKLSFLKWKLTVTSKDLEVYTETNKMRVNTR